MTDLFVGGVSFVLGSIAFGAAVFNWGWSFRLTKTQWLEGRFGRVGSRVVYALVGLGLIALGISLAIQGFQGA